MDIEEIGKEIIDSAIKVHTNLGPGLLESTYQICLSYELTQRGLLVVKEALLPIHYGDQYIESGYRVDMMMENCVIVENKTVTQLLPIHEAQLLTYLRLQGVWLGFLINWNTVRIKYGIKRMVNGPKPIN
jgi:GxxExxY protein